MSYLETLRASPGTPRNQCRLGTILESEGRDKYDEIIDAMLAIDEDPSSRTYGKLYSTARIVELFQAEYGFGEGIVRRHRNGACQACLSRPTKKN